MEPAQAAHDLTMYRRCQSAIAIIEEEFGVDWLSRRANKRRSPGHPCWHPVPGNWERAREAMAAFERSGRFVVNTSIATLGGLAGHLRAVRHLPNYQSVIRCALRDPRDGWEAFSKVRYVVDVAALGVVYGYSVAFVPTTDTRTADLEFVAQGARFLVECTKKAPLRPRKVNQGKLYKMLGDAIDRLQGELGTKYVISINAFGSLEEAAVPGIVQWVRGRLSDRTTGMIVGRDIGCAVEIAAVGMGETTRLPTLDGSFTVEVIARNGGMEVTGTSGFGLSVLDMHDLKSVFNTFHGKRQRKQLPEGTHGLLYIELDMSRLGFGHSGLIADLVADVLAREFSPAGNTRFAAVAVTSEPIPMPTDSLAQSWKVQGWTSVARNPFRPLPDGIRIPGEGEMVIMPGVS